MTLIVETGAGTPGANSYVTPTFVTEYLTARGRQDENSWATEVTRQGPACITATQYLDNRFGQLLRGTRLRTLIDGRQADGTLTLAQNPADAETLVVGVKTYRFVAALAQENDVLIGATVEDTLANLVVAITAGGDGVTVHGDTIESFEVSATASGATATITALADGLSGNYANFTTAIAVGATLDPSGGFLSGGLDQGPQPLEFPRDLRMYSSPRYGALGAPVLHGDPLRWPYPSFLQSHRPQYEGVPLKVRQATAEYAVRSLASKLDPDPVIDDRGKEVRRKREKFDVFEEETEYNDGATVRIHRPYPAADALMRDFLRPAGVTK